MARSSMTTALLRFGARALIGTAVIGLVACSASTVDSETKSSSGSTSGAGGSAASTTSSSADTSTSSTAVTSSSSGGSVPMNCTDANDGTGCCDPSGTLYYCDQNSMLVSQSCSSPQVCGWNAAKKYYDCVDGPATSDPSGMNPMACGGSPGSSTSSSAASSSSSSGGSATTWTELYSTVFGPSGTSNCSRNGGCHTNSQSGFKCGSTKASCYNGMVSSGLVNTGASASSSPLVDPSQSPLCGSLGGNMPKGGACVTASELSQIQSWLGAGAQNN